MPCRRYSDSTRMGCRPGRAGRLGWIRCRACTPGFSSAERRNRRSPSGSPSKSAGVQVQHPTGFHAKSGSRGKIQDRCCQGLIASAASQRRTVEADTDATTPRRLASAARSGQLHFASGRSVSAGSSHANAFTSATWTALNRRGRPDRGRSVRPASRCWQNRRRHFRTVSTCTPRSAAIPVFDTPSGGGQDDRGADHVAVSRSGAAGPDGQLVVFVGGQDDHIRGRDDHDLVVPQTQPGAATPRRGHDAVHATPGED